MSKLRLKGRYMGDSGGTRHQDSCIVSENYGAKGEDTERLRQKYVFVQSCLTNMAIPA